MRGRYVPLSCTNTRPLRVRTRGQYNHAPDFAAIAYALLHRIHLLTAIYASEPDSGWMRPLLARADGIATEQAAFALFEWDRRSGRQDRRIPMDGVLGSMTVDGDLTELAPFCDILDTRPAVQTVLGSRVKLMGRAIERKAHRHYFGRVFASAASLVSTSSDRYWSGIRSGVALRIRIGNPPNR